MAMEKLVIDRACWLQGEGEWRSKLLRKDDGKMCCLGFYIEPNGDTDFLKEGLDTEE